jgi:hypothetical protein
MPVREEANLKDHRPVLDFNIGRDRSKLRDLLPVY